LALFTIIALYVVVLISFYIFLVFLIDPGNQIANLDIPPIKDQIFVIGLILMGIVLMLTLLFSSIALILSSKISSSATIALVAGLGAIIPITGLIPTFTNKQSQTMITNPVSPLDATTIPRDKTISFIEQIIQDPNLNKTNILNLFKEVSTYSEKIENDKENNYINNLGVSSGE
jgi:ABC-type transport system involved in multi-copper enzyme maturation permease subunit